MLKYIYRRYCIHLFYKVQSLLVDLCAIYGEEAEVQSNVTLKQLVFRMDSSFLGGIKRTTSLEELKEIRSMLSVVNKELMLLR